MTSNSSFLYYGKGSLKHSTTIIQNVSDTANAWMRLSFQNMSGTEKTMVLITILWEIHKKAWPFQCGSKRCDQCLLKKVPSFVLIQTRYSTKVLNLFSSVTTEINLCKKLYGIVIVLSWYHCMVFNYLSQFL